MYYISEQLITTSKKELYKNLLEEGGLTYEETEVQLGVFDNNKLIGGISLDGNCIKLLKVLDEYNGQGISNILISDIIKIASEKNIFHLFVYTKPKNIDLFHSLGFYTIIKTKDVLFMENDKRGILNFVSELEKNKVIGNKICGLVMNLNPLTKGHEYLISRASCENDVVHVIIVKEDKSVFPYEIRLQLLKDVASKYKNVIVHEGSDYCVSNATFPTYFIKSKESVPNIYATLDCEIFANYVAKALDINVRYVGEEPYSKTTKMYNDVMKELLPKYNIEVVEIPRETIDNNIISASKVRELIKNNEIQKAFTFLPKETVELLESEIGKKIIEKIKVSNNRH